MAYLCASIEVLDPTDAYLVRHFLEGNHVEVRRCVAISLTLRGEIPVGDVVAELGVGSTRRRNPALRPSSVQFHGPRCWFILDGTCACCGEVNEATFEWCWNCQTDRPVTSA